MPKKESRDGFFGYTISSRRIVQKVITDRAIARVEKGDSLGESLTKAAKEAEALGFAEEAGSLRKDAQRTRKEELGLQVVQGIVDDSSD